MLIALYIVAIVCALTISVALLLPRGQATVLHTDADNPAPEAESELLRRPLRSRLPV